MLGDRRAMQALGAVGGLGIVVAVGIGLGIWAGRWADGRWGIGPWGTVAGMLLGLASAILECWHVLKRAVSTTDHDPDHKSRNDAADRK